MEWFVWGWETIILRPVVNILIWLSYYLFNSFGASIIALTILMRVITYPLTARQLRSTKAMQTIQPKIAELQKKYAKDKNALAREQMRLYKEAVQRGWHKPGGLPGTDAGPDAYLDSRLPINHAGAGHCPGGFAEPVTLPVFMAGSVFYAAS